MKNSAKKRPLKSLAAVAVAAFVAAAFDFIGLDTAVEPPQAVFASGSVIDGTRVEGGYLFP